MSRKTLINKKMRKTLLLIIIMVSSISLLEAQITKSISGGVKLINSDTRTITLHYVDESPSMDNLSTNANQTGNLAFQLNFRFQDAKDDRNYHFFGEGQGYLGSINGLALNCGILFRGKGKIKIQPEMSGIIGFSQKSIGEIKNNDVYIQVNNTRFKDYTDVQVSLRNIYYGIKLGLSFSVNTGTNSEIGFGVNYQLSAKVGSIVFSGKGQDGKSTSDTEGLGEKNVGFYVDGYKTDKIPYNPDGLELKIFYSF